VSFLVRRAVPGDSVAIRDLFARTFGRPMTPQEWSWKYPANPDGWIAFVAEVDGRIVGHYGGWPIRALIGGVEETIVAIGDVATDRSVRHLGGRRSVFRSMAEEMFARLRAEGAPFVFGFPNARAFAAGERLLGYRPEFAVREVVYEIGSPPRGPGVASEWLDEGYDDLWKRVACSLDAGVVRDRQRMNWRYHARPDRYYRFVTLAPRPAACGVLSVVGDEALVMEALAESGEAAPRARRFAGGRGGGDGRSPSRFLGDLRRADGLGGRGIRSRPGGTVRDAGFAFVTVTFHAGKRPSLVRRARSRRESTTTGEARSER
jgi:hypothetical protein